MIPAAPIPARAFLADAGSATAGLPSSRASGGISDTARLEHHARQAWGRNMAEFEALERGVPDVDAAHPHYAAARRLVCLRIRKERGA